MLSGCLSIICVRVLDKEGGEDEAQCDTYWLGCSADSNSYDSLIGSIPIGGELCGRLGDQRLAKGSDCLPDVDPSEVLVDEGLHPHAHHYQEGSRQYLKVNK